MRTDTNTWSDRGRGPGSVEPRHRGPRRSAPGLRRIVLVSILVLTASSVSGEVWASNADGGSGGPEQLTSAMLSPSPTPDGLTNGGCAATDQQTNVGTSWTDSQSATQDASGGSLITGYTVSRSAASGGTYVAAGTTSGSPPPTSFADAPTVANSPVALVADGTAAGSKIGLPVHRKQPHRRCRNRHRHGGHRGQRHSDDSRRTNCGHRRVHIRPGPGVHMVWNCLDTCQDNRARHPHSRRHQSGAQWLRKIRGLCGERSGHHGQRLRHPYHAQRGEQRSRHGHRGPTSGEPHGRSGDP